MSFFRAKLKAFESEPLRVAQPVRRGNTVGVRFRIPLASMAPGPYVCQVNVVAELDKKFALRRSPLVLLP